jgi:purine-nucleoside phosphorylase
MLNRIQEAVDFIQSKTQVKPEFGIILGTGLGGLVKEIEIIDEIPYEQIPNFPVSTVESHKGRLIFGV